MTPAVEILDDSSAATRRAAELIGRRLRKGASTVALSRGAELLACLAAENVDWREVAVFQVDERVAEAGHADRNLEQLLAVLPVDAIHPMPVEEANLDSAAERYSAGLPAALDLVHLGLGPDGHTASLVPGDAVLDVRDRLVAVSGEYEGSRRMTLTYPALEAAREIVWLVTGEAKRDALALLLARDASIPGARIDNPSQLVVADRAAAGSP